MLKEFFGAVKGDFKPVAKVVDGKNAIHKDYQIIEEPKGINYKDKIVRHRINESILDKKDFIKFINEYKTPETKIFFDDNDIRAIFNYSTPGEADHCDSSCRMILEKTKNFQEFVNCLDRDLSQKELIRILKRLESCIVGFNNKPVDDMDIIEVAENLHASKNINSVQRNTAKAFMIDATVSAGNKSYEIPRFVHFKLPVFKNDRTFEVEFACELFLEAGETSFFANLVCYKLDDVIEETIKKITDDVCNGCEGIKSYLI